MVDKGESTPFPVVKLGSWPVGRDSEMVGLRTSSLGSFCLRVGVIGWTGWERAAASVPGTALPQYWLDRLRRRLLHAAAAAAAPVFVVEGPFSPRPHEPNGYCFLFFLISFLFTRIPKGKLSILRPYQCTHYTRAAVWSCWRSWQDCR